MRRGLFLATALLLVLAASAATAQTGTGTMNVHLVPPAGKTLTQSTILAFNPSTGFVRSTMFGDGIGPFVITGLPAANDYGTSVLSTASTGETCNGSTLGIPIVANQTTLAFVSLTCPPPPASVPALGRYAPLLLLSLALLGVLAARRRSWRA